MKFSKSVVCVPVLWTILSFGEVYSEIINAGLVNKNVDITIDISSQLVKISQKVTLENIGKTATKFFLLATDPKIKDNFAFLSAQVGDIKLRVSEVKVDQHADKFFWRVDLREDLQPGKTSLITVDSVLTHELHPHPAQITQREKQLILYEGNVFFYSPYPATRQKSVVTLNSHTVESYAQVTPVSHSDNTITYGPYDKIPAFTKEKMSIHYENNAPFLAINQLLRVIEVSHWGNIAVEETVDIEHTGAKLKGPFSRYEYQRETQSGLASVKFFKTALPASASDVYYRDEIGNISTSHMRVLSDSVELDLRPRFPLFGGWKTHYVLGYNVPSYEYLFNSGDQFVLKMRLLDHVFDDMIVDELITKIILPEGSHSVELSTSYPVKRLQDNLHFTYLDTKGRPVISISKNNLVENHIDDFEDEAEESRMRTAGYCDKVLANQDKRAAVYQNLDDLLSKLKTNKDLNSFQASVKTINQDHKAVSNNINELMGKLKQDALDIFEKVSELQRLDKQLREIYTGQQNLYVEKLVPNKIHRNTFLEVENEINKKKEECTDKINSIIKSLQ